MNKIDHEEIIRAECRQSFPADFFQKAQELRIQDFAVECKPYGVRIRTGKIRKPFALPDALPEDKVHSLSGPLYKPAFAEDLCNAAVPGILLPEYILRGDAGREPPGADNFNATGILTDKYGAAASVVAMAHSIQNCFPNRALVEGRDVPDKQPLLEMLEIIAQVDESPDFIQYGEEALSELPSFGGGPRRVAGPIFEYDFCLSEVSSEGFPLTEQNKRSVRQLPAHDQFRIRKELFHGT